MTNTERFTTKEIVLPLPNDEYDGRIVMASCWLRDDDIVLGLLMLLSAESPYYSVAQIKWTDGYWHNNGETVHLNINHATEHFADSGGDV